MAVDAADAVRHLFRRDPPFAFMTFILYSRISDYAFLFIGDFHLKNIGYCDFICRRSHHVHAFVPLNNNKLFVLFVFLHFGLGWKTSARRNKFMQEPAFSFDGRMRCASFAHKHNNTLAMNMNRLWHEMKCIYPCPRHSAIYLCIVHVSMYQWHCGTAYLFNACNIIF